jgi:uncharacterized protein (DUF58 family)
VSGSLRFSRVHVRLTRAGQLYIALTLALGVVAVNSGNNLLYLATAGLLALMSLAGTLAYVNLRGLRVNLRPPDEVYAGRPATLTLELSNTKPVPSFLLTCGKEARSEGPVEIPSGGKAQLTLEMEFPRRGLAPVGTLTILSPFPFGMVRRGGSFDPGLTCVVYPRPQAVPWLFLEHAERRGEEQSLPLAGAGGDYRGIRDYLPGDSLSRVHWKGWLRHRRLMSKEFESEGAQPVHFSFDAVPGPDIERRLSQLTWLIRTELRRGRAVGLTLPGRTFPPAAGPAHRKQLLTALALFGVETDARP